MATRTQIYREVLRDLDMLRTAKAGELRERKDRIYARLPRLEEIERELAILGAKTARIVLQSGADFEEVVLQMQKSQQSLIEERNDILKQNKIPALALQMEFECERCEDSGYVGTEKCTCLKKRFMDKMYSQSNVRDIIRVENFASFKEGYYYGESDRRTGLSPKDNAILIKNRAIAFVEMFDSTADNLLLYGGTGLGKTFLCNCIAKELMERGRTVLYLTAGKMFRQLEDEHFHYDEEEEMQDWKEELLDADLLIIDDLGTEFMTAFTTTELFRIINGRKLAGKSVVISTNLTPEELQNQYSDRIASRILGEYQLLKLYGDDIRLTKKYNTK